MIIPERFHKNKPSRLIVAIIPSKKSMPLVLPLSEIMATSFSAISKLSSTPRMKIANRAVDLISVLSSSIREYNEKFCAYAVKLSSKEYPSFSTRRSMVRLERLIFAKVSFFSGHKTLETRTMHSFTISPSEKGFDFFAIVSATKKLAFIIDYCCKESFETTDCCPRRTFANSFTFSCLHSV